MILLALDTTTRAGSVALLGGRGVLEERVGDASRTHGVRLPGEIVALLNAHDLGVGDVDVYAVAAGPGSFTGVRVGVAAIQGLALVHDRRVVPVSALDALAHVARSAGGDMAVTDRIAAWMDAQRGEVFNALYSARGGRAIEDASVASPEATLDRWGAGLSEGTTWFVGDGAERYRARIEARLGPAARVIAPTPALAGAIAVIAADEWAAGGAIAPHAIRPLYVRRPDAELARDGPPQPIWVIEPIDRARDLEGLLDIEQASFSNPWTRDMFVWELENADVTRLYVARAGERLVAFCSAWLVVDELHINNLAVRPEWRRRGVASALLARVLADAAARGARRATLEVRRSNEAALSLYRRLGFQVAGARAAYYSNPTEDALILWRGAI